MATLLSGRRVVFPIVAPRNGVCALLIPYRARALVVEQLRLRGVFDQCEDLAGHEPGRADRDAGPRDLHDLDHAAADAHLDPATGPGGRHLVRPGRVAGVDHDLDPVVLHAPMVSKTCSIVAVRTASR